jgi:hypothetical protein
VQSRSLTAWFRTGICKKTLQISSFLDGDASLDLGMTSEAQ